MQDEVTDSVAAAIEPHLLAAEGVRALSRQPDDLGAWELVARAQTHFWRMTTDDYEQAIDEPEAGRRRSIRIMRRARSLLGLLPDVCRSHGMDRSQPRSRLGPRARDARDRAR